MNKKNLAVCRKLIGGQKMKRKIEYVIILLQALMI